MTDRPKQVGVAERKNRTLVECARIMLQGKNISNCFWAKYINIVVYLNSMSPTNKLELQTPFESFYGYKPRISHLIIFGCRAFAHIPKDDRRKLDVKSIECVFVGYCDDHKAYKLFHPSSHRLIASRDVVFHENTDISNRLNNYDEGRISYDNVKIDKIV